LAPIGVVALVLVCLGILPISGTGTVDCFVHPQRREGFGKVTKILLVEDSKFLRMATERALARAGYVMRTAADGLEAIELTRQEQPDVILLDMMLPKKSGPDVLKALKKDPTTQTIPVVAFTGLSEKNAKRLQEDGACAYLEKSALCLDKGCETLLNALGEILRELGLETPGLAKSQGAR